MTIFRERELEYRDFACIHRGLPNGETLLSTEKRMPESNGFRARVTAIYTKIFVRL
jgi:hypothetical protein